MSDTDVNSLIDWLQQLSVSDNIESFIVNSRSATNRSYRYNVIPQENTMPNNFQEYFLKVIPEFDGEPANAGNFLKSCDLIMNQFYDAEQPLAYLNHFLLNFVQSKLVGNARLIISTKVIKSWVDLRRSIIENFTDQRDETSLLGELLSLKQKPQEDALTFSNRCRYLEQLLISGLDCNEQNEGVKEIKKRIYAQQTLRAFLGGLRNPLGLAVRSMSPNSIENALKFIIEEENYQYRDRMFTNNRNPNSQNNYNQTRRTPTNNISHMPNLPHVTPQNFPAIQFQRSTFQPRQSDFSRQFNRPEMHRNPRPQYQPNLQRNNNFHRQNNYIPEPMDVSTTRTRNTVNTHRSRSQMFPRRQNNQFQAYRRDPTAMSVDEVNNHEIPEASNLPSTSHNPSSSQEQYQQFNDDDLYDTEIENFRKMCLQEPEI